MEIVGKVIFMGHILPVYDSLDKPLFKASDFFDEETGMMMQSVTVAGGDVEQIPLF